MAHKENNIWVEDSVPGLVFEVGAIGDSGYLTPRLKVKKWDGSHSFSLLYGIGSGTEEYEEATKKIKWKGVNEELHFYPVEVGYEMELILKNKHASKKFYFTLDGNVVFHRQSPMSERIGLDGIVTANDTQGFDSQGDIIHRQSEENVNSYAVYSATPLSNIKGGVEYQTGKICHISRIKATDKNGVQVWCGMNIIGNVMEISLPNGFGDSSSQYPIIIDPTFGYSTVGASSAVLSYPVCHVGSGLIYAAGSRQRITLFSVYGSGGGCDAALYTIAGGVPVNRFDAAVAIDLPVSAGWANSAAVSQIMANGATYGMATGNYATVTFYYDLTSGNQRSAESRSGALQTPWSHANYSAAQYSWYATYEQYNEDVL